MTRILAVDPGVKTGWAVFDTEVDKDPRNCLIEAGQAPHEEFMAEYLIDIRNLEYDEVVCEDYRITPQTLKKTWQPASLHQIGALKYACQEDCTGFTLQTPAEGKRFSDDDKLKALGWYKPTPGGHRNDAVRHLLLYLVKRQWMDLSVLMENT